MKLTVLSALLLQSAFLFGQTPSKNPAPVPGIPMAMALSHLTNLHQAPSADSPRTSSEGMAVYRIIVTPDGALERWERVAGDTDVQNEADRVIGKWRFTPLTLKGATSPTSWWSLVGLCYAKDWGGPLPCSPPQGVAIDPKLKVSPQRIFLDKTVEAGAELNLAPLEKIKGRTFTMPFRAKSERVQGETIIDLNVAPDGSVSTTPVSGHPILIDDTLSTVKNWRFTPVIFLGTSVEVQLRLVVEYSDPRY